MASLVYQLIIAIALLAVVPQLAGWLVGSFAGRRGTWVPVIVAIFVAPLVFWLIAAQLYAPGGQSLVQFTAAEAGGPIEVANLQQGALAHGVGALALQIFHLIRGR